MTDAYRTIRYDVAEGISCVTLNRPERLNTIVPPMPDEFAAASRRAALDADVGVVVVGGAGRAFCAGYDFGGGFHHWEEALSTEGGWGDYSRAPADRRPNPAHNIAADPFAAPNRDRCAAPNP